MMKAQDIATQQFIDSIEVLNSTQYQILQKLREIVFEQYPESKERMMYGGIMFSLEADYGGIFVYKNHVSFEFGNGYRFDDPNKVLEGGGKYRRHLKLKSLDDVEAKQVDFFVKQIIGMEG